MRFEDGAVGQHASGGAACRFEFAGDRFCGEGVERSRGEHFRVHFDFFFGAARLYGEHVNAMQRGVDRDSLDTAFGFRAAAFDFEGDGALECPAFAELLDPKMVFFGLVADVDAVIGRVDAEGDRVCGPLGELTVARPLFPKPGKLAVTAAGACRGDSRSCLQQTPCHDG
ncbi:MAG TPA: hypothetical protein VHU13_03560 [Solirubrobacteraceae bacterium]|nr:hypothetical protein [Solirubrobacteraceae bacterium]